MLDEELVEFNKKYPLKYISFHNTKWEYLNKGSGKVTFLIFPGGGQYAQSQYMMASTFSDKYKVIIPSIYDVYSIDDCCEAVNKILEKEHSDKLIVYGLSIGALIAQSYVKRNLNRISTLIISHGCAPDSPNYKKKVIKPLQILNLILPIVPSFLIKFIAKNFAGRIQGISKNVTQEFNTTNLKKDIGDNAIRKLLARKFYEQYLTKILLYTWIKLHFDFYHHEKFSSNDFKNWFGKVLIIRTDNDPLMQDGGKFKSIYPNATVKTFSGTGHLTDIYQFDEVIQTIKSFIY